MKRPLQVRENGSATGLQESPRALRRKRNQAGPPAMKFVQLKSHLVEQVRSGRWGPGAGMPSEPSLAEEFSVSRRTVRRALSEMEEEGIIRREQGRGTFVNEGIHRQLRTATGTFALIMSGAREIETLTLIRGFEKACRDMGRSMVLCDSDNDFYQQGDTILRLSHLEVSGVAILPVSEPLTPVYHVSPLQERGIPVVMCHRGAESSKSPVMSVPHEKQGRLVGQAFVDTGHRHVALMLGYRLDGTILAKWVRGLRESLQGVGGELLDEFIYSAQTTMLNYVEQKNELVETLESMLSVENPPTAIFAIGDRFAQTVYFALEEMGLRVPDDISLVGLGDVDRNGPFLQRLTSVVVDEENVGRQAALLLGQMQSGQRNLRDCETIEVLTSLSDGQTLGSAPETPVRYCRQNKTQAKA